MSAVRALGEQIVPLAWDSAFFGFPVAQLTAERLDESALAAATVACRARGIRCAYLLLDGDDAHGSALAQADGFALRDVRLTFERELGDASAADAGHAAPTPRPAIGPATAGQHAALETLAREAFTHTRFLADPHFPQERSRELYAAMLRRGLDGGPERVTLADGDARGFVVCRLDTRDGVGTIELIAVAASARGGGLGAALVTAALARFRAAGLHRAQVATQAANVASQRLYQRTGFRTCAAHLWLHRWF